METWKDEMIQIFLRNVRNEIIKHIKGYIRTEVIENNVRISILDRENNVIYYRDYNDIEKMIYDSVTAESLGWDFYKHMQTHIRKKYFKPNKLR